MEKRNQPETAHTDDLIDLGVASVETKGGSGQPDNDDFVVLRKISALSQD